MRGPIVLSAWFSSPDTRVTLWPAGLGSNPMSYNDLRPSLPAPSVTLP